MLEQMPSLPSLPLLHTFLGGDLTPRITPWRFPLLQGHAELRTRPLDLTQWGDVADRSETRVRAVTAGKSKDRDGKRLVSRHSAEGNTSGTLLVTEILYCKGIWDRTTVNQDDIPTDLPYSKSDNFG